MSSSLPTFTSNDGEPDRHGPGHQSRAGEVLHFTGTAGREPGCPL